MQNWFGWVLFFLSFYLLFLNREFRENKKTFAIIFFSLLIRSSLNIYISFFNLSLISGMDPMGFHGLAQELMNNPQFGFQVTLFGSFLSVFYRIFGVSFFMGSELCILVYLASCLVLLKLIKKLNLSRYQTFLLFLYGFLPNMIAWTSLEMREGFEVFFFMFASLKGIDYLRFPSFKKALAVLIFSLLFGVFHFALLAYSIAFSMMVLVWPFLRLPKPTKLFSVVAVVTVCILASQGVFLALSKLHLKELAWYVDIAKHPLEFFSFAEKFRKGMASEGGRTIYRKSLDTSSARGLLTSSFVLLFYYLFTPFPWQVSTSLDGVAACESILRLALILLAIREWVKSKGEKRNFYSLFLFAYFSMSYIWSLGVTNYGTSVRHNITDYWILVLLGGPALAKFLKVPVLRHREA